MSELVKIEIKNQEAKKVNDFFTRKLAIKSKMAGDYEISCDSEDLSFDSADS